MMNLSYYSVGMSDFIALFYLKAGSSCVLILSLSKSDKRKCHSFPAVTTMQNDFEHFVMPSMNYFIFFDHSRSCKVFYMELYFFPAMRTTKCNEYKQRRAFLKICVPCFRLLLDYCSPYYFLV